MCFDLEMEMTDLQWFVVQISFSFSKKRKLWGICILCIIGNARNTCILKLLILISIKKRMFKNNYNETDNKNK